MKESMVRNYRSRKAEIKAIAWQISDLYDTRRSVSTILQRSGTRNRAGPVVKAVDKIIGLEDRLAETVEKYAAEGQEIEDWLQTLHDPTMATIIRARFMAGRSWSEVCNLVYNYPVESTCRTYYTRHKSEFFEEEV